MRLSVTIQDASLAYVDPSVLTLKLQKPDGTETSYIFGSSAIVKDSVGHYHYDFVVDTPGHWPWKYIGTGNMNVASPDGKVIGLPTELP